MSRLFLIISIVVLVLVGAGAFLYSRLDDTVRQIVEVYAAELAGVEVSVEEVHLSLADKEGTLEELVIGNAEGYSAPYSVMFGKISVALNEGNFYSNPIYFKRVEISDIDIQLEMGLQGSNLYAIRDHVMENRHKTWGNNEGRRTFQTVAIDEFVMKNVRVHVVTSMANAKDAGTFTIPEIRVENIAETTFGNAAHQVFEALVTELNENQVKNISPQNIKAGKEMLRKKIKEMY